MALIGLIVLGLSGQDRASRSTCSWASHCVL